MRNSVRFLGRTCIRGGSYENQRVWENQAAVLMRTNPINQWCFLKWQMAVLIRTAARFSGRTSFKKHPSVLLKIVSENQFSGKTYFIQFVPGLGAGKWAGGQTGFGLAELPTVARRVFGEAFWGTNTCG